MANCTAGLKLVAENFRFIESLPQSRDCVSHDCLDGAHCATDPTATADCFCKSTIAGDFEEFPVKYQHDEEALHHKSVEDQHNLCDASRAVSDAKCDTCISSTDCVAAAAAAAAAAACNDDEDDGGCDTHQHLELPISCCEWTCEPVLKPTFLYLDDNHTSVIGMRGILAHRGAQFCCITADKVDTFLSSLQQTNVNPLSSQSVTTHVSLSHDRPRYIINSLFAYPAQSNFSGYRYPLEWVNAVRCRSECEPATTSGTCPHWYVLLDAAALLTTSTLDLTLYKPDFVVLSFYKMFGFPTGLGMLMWHELDMWLLCRFGIHTYMHL